MSCSALTPSLLAIQLLVFVARSRTRNMTATATEFGLAVHPRLVDVLDTRSEVW